MTIQQKLQYLFYESKRKIENNQHWSLSYTILHLFNHTKMLNINNRRLWLETLRSKTYKNYIVVGTILIIHWKKSRWALKTLENILPNQRWTEVTEKHVESEKSRFTFLIERLPNLLPCLVRFQDLPEAQGRLKYYKHPRFSVHKLTSEYSVFVHFSPFRTRGY